MSDLQLLRKAMADAGQMAPADFLPDGITHNYGVDGDHEAGPLWYCLVGDQGLICAYGNHVSGDRNLWFSEALEKSTAREQQTLCAALERSIKLIHQQIRLDLDAECEFANALFAQASHVDRHPYLSTHKVEAFGIRCDGDYLLVPIRDANQQIRSLQRISIDGSKEILHVGFKSGCYFSIGKPNEVLVICLDYVTAASIHMATGWSAAVAFFRENLLPVATLLQSKFPHLAMLIAEETCPLGTKFEPGKSTQKAFEQLNARVVVPNIRDKPTGTTCNFNDLHVMQGLDAVRSQLIRKAEDF